MQHNHKSIVQVVSILAVSFLDYDLVFVLFFFLLLPAPDF